MKVINGLFKWFVILAVGLAAALSAIVLFSNHPSFNAFLLRLTILAAVGFFGGITGRLLFRKTPAFFAVLLVFTAAIPGIILIDQFYDSPYIFDFIDKDLKFSIPSISDGSQITLMVLALLLPTFFLRRKQKVTMENHEKAAKPRRASLFDEIKLKMSGADPHNWKMFKQGQKAKPQKTFSTKSRASGKRSSAVLKPTTASSHRTPSRVSANRSAVHPSVVMKKPTKKLKIPGKARNGNGNEVKLVGEEEHVCPYCLEEVLKGDPAGVVVCPECGTWHHQDCWNLTGSCGVAHRNEL